MSSFVEKRLSTPVGILRLRANDSALVGVYFPDHRRAPVPVSEASNHPVLEQAARELTEYFAGRRETFSTPLQPIGTEFQREVWLALTRIPYARHSSYAELAQAIGRPRAIRAVGAANARNPLSIFVPCHRVIGSSGALTGYAGGMPAKQWLLEHERGVAGQ